MKLNFLMEKNHCSCRRKAGKFRLCNWSSKFCNVRVFLQSGVAQIELWENSKKYKNKVYVLPKELDEKVARIHLEKIGAKLTQLTNEQGKYINVPVKVRLKIKSIDIKL